MSIGKHTLANLTGAIIPMAVALVTVPLYLKYIGVERYGVLAVIWALLGYFGFMDLGLGRAVTQRMSRQTDATDSDRSNMLWTAISLSFFIGVAGSTILWLGADYLLSSSIEMSDSLREESKSAVYWLLPALPLFLPASALSGALQARLRFVELNIIQVTGGVLGQLLPIFIAVMGYVELSFLVPAALSARLLTIVLLYRQCRRHIPLTGTPHIDRTHLSPMLGYGGWISVISVLAPLLVTIDRLVIATLSGARAVAHYTVPYDLVSRSMVISGSLSSALFPRLASASDEEGRALAKRASALLVAVMTPITIIGLFVVHPFLIFWVGEEFATASYGVAELILLGVWVNAMVIPHHARFLATDNPRTIAVIFMFEIPIYFLLLWQGITHWGVMGAAAAWSLRVLLDTTLLLRLNNVLAYTFRSIISSALLVVSAFYTVITDLGIIEIIIFVTLFILLSLFKDRHLLLAAYSQLRQKQVVVT